MVVEVLHSPCPLVERRLLYLLSSPYPGLPLRPAGPYDRPP
jgi:hypothetical protein